LKSGAAEDDRDEAAMSGDGLSRRMCLSLGALRNYPDRAGSRIRPEKRPSLLESEPAQGRRIDGRATPCPQSWYLLKREIGVTTCVGRTYYIQLNSSELAIPEN
jgi:hypothetical protein